MHVCMYVCTQAGLQRADGGMGVAWQSKGGGGGLSARSQYFCDSVGVGSLSVAPAIYFSRRRP